MKTTTKERPILFSAPMVRAILDGRKTVTRRVVKTEAALKELRKIEGECLSGVHPYGMLPAGRMDVIYATCPYGIAGDRLWVREAMRLNDYGFWAYAADDRVVEVDPTVAHHMADWAHHKTTAHCPSIHMPRWASRLTIEVVSVRVERLQCITEEDARAEGVFEHNNHTFDGGFAASHGLNRRDAFAKGWDSIHGPGSWNSNPWVWRIEFRRLP